jgi:hypothetical protein
MAITSASITTTAASVYTSTGSNAITCIIVCNLFPFTASNPALNATNFYLYAVSGGGTPADVNLIVNGLPITAGETLSLDQEKLVLENGDKLYAKADDGSTLVMTISTLAV